jgi:hypothetical protein
VADLKFVSSRTEGDNIVMMFEFDLSGYDQAIRRYIHDHPGSVGVIRGIGPGNASLIVASPPPDGARDCDLYLKPA